MLVQSIKVFATGERSLLVDWYRLPTRSCLRRPAPDPSPDLIPSSSRNCRLYRSLATFSGPSRQIRFAIHGVRRGPTLPSPSSSLSRETTRFCPSCRTLVDPPCRPTPSENDGWSSDISPTRSRPQGVDNPPPPDAKFITAGEGDMGGDGAEDPSNALLHPMAAEVMRVKRVLDLMEW